MTLYFSFDLLNILAIELVRMVQKPYYLQSRGRENIVLNVDMFLLQALLNPMQALLNAFVYRKWSSSERNVLPATTYFKGTFKEFNFYDEQSPLLGSEPPRLPLSPIPPSINNYATL